jgi:hypothetical protein
VWLFGAAAVVMPFVIIWDEQRRVRRKSLREELERTW